MSQVLYRHTDGKAYTADVVGFQPFELEIVDPGFPGLPTDPARYIPNAKFTDLVPTCICGSTLHSPAESIRCTP